MITKSTSSCCKGTVMGMVVFHRWNRGIVTLKHNSWKVKEQPMGRGLELTLIIDGAAMRCGIE